MQDLFYLPDTSGLPEESSERAKVYGAFYTDSLVADFLVTVS